MQERIWFDCQMCNGSGKVIWWETVYDDGKEIICPECDGKKGWWIKLDTGEVT